MKREILLLITLSLTFYLCNTQRAPQVTWQEVNFDWRNPYQSTPIYVLRIDFIYDKARSSGNFSSKTLANDIEPGFLNTIKVHNYTYPKNSTFEDFWSVNWYDEHKIKDLLMPPTLDVLQPIVNEQGQLEEAWSTRPNLRFGKRDLYQKEFLYWTNFKIPMGMCKEIQVRENKRNYKVND